MPAIPGLNRSDELEKQGTFFSAARRKISIASARLPATGLSMNSGLPAAITGRACSKCLRPSRLSSNTASTRSSRAGIESTISTPPLRSLLGVLRHATDAVGNVLAAAGKRGHHPHAGKLGAGVGIVDSALVKAGTCEVSQPMMPIRSGSARRPCASRSRQIVKRCGQPNRRVIDHRMNLS